MRSSLSRTASWMARLRLGKRRCATSWSTRRRRTLSIVMATLAAAMTSPRYDVFSYHGWQRFNTDARWHQGRAHMREQRTGPRRIEFAERGFAALDTPRAREARESFTRGAGRGSGRRPGLGASEARSACGARASTGRAPRREAERESAHAGRRGSGGIGSAQRVRRTREHWTGPQEGGRARERSSWPTGAWGHRERAARAGQARALDGPPGGRPSARALELADGGLGAPGARSAGGPGP